MTACKTSSSRVIAQRSRYILDFGSFNSELDKLTIADLRGCKVARFEEECELQAVCPALRSLDLSSNLLCDWSKVASCARALPRLQVLRLKFVVCDYIFHRSTIA